MIEEATLWLVEEARRRLSVEICSVMILREETKDLIVTAAIGLPNEIVSKARGRVGQDIAGWVAANGAPLLIKDIKEDLHFMRRKVKRRYYNNSLLSVPIKDNGHIFGVLNLNNKIDHAPFCQEDLNKATELVAESISRFTLPVREKKKIEEQTRELDLLLSFSQEVSSSLYLSEVIKAVSEALFTLLDTEIILLSLFSQKRIWLFSRRRLTKRLFSEAEKHFEDRARLLLEVKPAISDFEWTTIKMKELSSKNSLKELFSSYTSLPILLGERETGLISVLRSNYFTKEELRILAIITNSAAVAINNTLLHQKTEEELNRTKKKLISSEKMAAVGKVTEKTSHDLRNPLSAIRIFLELLKEKTKDSKSLDLLGKMETSLSKMMRLCEDLLDFGREIQLERTDIDINRLIKDSLSFTEHKLEKIEKSLNFSPECETIWADPRRLDQVFTNIILNAAQAMKEEGKLRIETKRSKINDKEFVEIRFSDTGPGIPPEIKEKIFEPFFTTRTKGIGLGLSICKEIVEKHGGSLRIESSLGQGTTFHILLPIEKKI